MKKFNGKKQIIFISLLVMLFAMSSIVVYGAKSTVLSGNNSDERVWVKSIDNANKTGDLTYLKISKVNKRDYYMLVDVGMTKHIDSLLNTDSYNTKESSLKIDYLTITHSHLDHIGGLKELTDRVNKGKIKKIVVNNMFINTNHINTKESQKKNVSKPKDIYANFLNNSKITINNLYLVGYKNQPKNDIKKDASIFMNKVSDAKKKSIKSINYMNNIINLEIGQNASDTTQRTNIGLTIVPAHNRYNNKKTVKGKKVNDLVKNENDASMNVIVYDNKTSNSHKKFKVIFAGDLQAKGLKSICDDNTYNSLYSNIQNGITFDSIYYKASHHAKRNRDTFIGKYVTKKVTVKKKTKKKSKKKAKKKTKKVKVFEYAKSSFRRYEATLLVKFVRPNYIIGSCWKRKGNDGAKRYFDTYNMFYDFLTGKKVDKYKVISDMIKKYNPIETKLITRFGGEKE